MNAKIFRSLEYRIFTYSQSIFPKLHNNYKGNNVYYSGEIDTSLIK